MKTINYDMIPPHMRDSMRLYIENGIPGGSFMHALLTNKLIETFSHADAINSVCISAYVDFLLYEAPRGCFGSEENVRHWCEIGGLYGRNNISGSKPVDTEVEQE